MPTGLKITIVFNFIAVAILCSVASMAEPTKNPIDSGTLIKVPATVTSSRAANEYAGDLIVMANSSSVKAEQFDTQRQEQSTEAIPAPWLILPDGSVQWEDAP